MMDPFDHKQLQHHYYNINFAPTKRQAPSQSVYDMSIGKRNDTLLGEGWHALRPYDVVCGRGSASYNNCGNRRFRVFISMNLERYIQCKGRHEKSEFIGSLVQTLTQEIGARFYKSSASSDDLVEMELRDIRQKVGHALRDSAAFNATSQHRTKSKSQRAKATSSPQPSLQQSQPQWNSFEPIQSISGNDMVEWMVPKGPEVESFTTNGEMNEPVENKWEMEWAKPKGVQVESLAYNTQQEPEKTLPWSSDEMKMKPAPTGPGDTAAASGTLMDPDMWYNVDKAKDRDNAKHDGSG